MRARVTRRQVRGTGAQGGHVEERAEGNPHELQQCVGLNGGVVNNRGEGGNRLLRGVSRRGFCARGGAGTFVRLEHGAQGDEVVVQGQTAQGEGGDRLRVGEGEFPADAGAEGEADNVRARCQLKAEVVLGGDGAQQLGEHGGE